MYRVIKSTELKNKSQYRWFKTFDNPCYGFNVKVDVSEVIKYSKETKTSFFINVLYLITTSLNSIEEFRIREVKDEIRIYDKINPTFTVMTNIGVYENAALIYTLDTYVFTLPDIDKQLLREGIITASKTELYELIEEYY